MSDNSYMNSCGLVPRRVVISMINTIWDASSHGGEYVPIIGSRGQGVGKCGGLCNRISAPYKNAVVGGFEIS